MDQKEGSGACLSWQWGMESQEAEVTQTNKALWRNGETQNLHGEGTVEANLGTTGTDQLKLFDSCLSKTRQSSNFRGYSYLTHSFWAL